MSKIYGYTVTTPMNPHKARAVFVGNENTTLAEFFEAYQNKKACFLYRPRGGSGYEQWTLYHANTSQARFYMIEQNGKIMVGTLKSDGNWSYVIHEVSGWDVDLSGYAKIEDVPTDDHINALINNALGNSIEEIDTLLGGDS